MDKQAIHRVSVDSSMIKSIGHSFPRRMLEIEFKERKVYDIENSKLREKAIIVEEEKAVEVELKEGNLLTNVFNRILRSCLYTIQKYDDSVIPCLPVSEIMLETTKEKVLEYERHMYNHDFHRITYVLDDYIRFLNKQYANNSKRAEEDAEFRAQLLSDCFYGIKAALLLLHPIAPTGCEMAREYLGLSKNVFSWEYVFAGVEEVLEDALAKTKFLEPRVDFFKKHESQFEK